MNSLIRDLQMLIRQPSVSSKNEGMHECATLLKTIMTKAGINTTILYLEDKKSAPPIVYGEIRSRSNPYYKTLLFYNHYDVQPVEPVSAWTHDPFSGHIIGNKIYGRGASDDKGELITRIKAVEHILNDKGDVPCNIKFFIEGEEEIGSPSLRRYLQQLTSTIQADGIIWEFGYIDPKNRPIINLGMKGMLYVEMTSYGPSSDLHSSLAPIVRNPAWEIVRMLSTLWDEKNAIILIKDWYRELIKLTQQEIEFISNQPIFDEFEFKKKYRINDFLRSVHGYETKMALMTKPTCNISALNAGDPGKSARTVIPSVASVKIDFRLVPDMDPEMQFERLKTHLRENGFSNIHPKFIHSIRASRTPFTDPFVGVVMKSAERVFGWRPIVNLSSAGSGPMRIFMELLRCPCIAAGCTSMFANIHSQNEYARIDLLNKGTKFIIDVIKNFAI
jgi:acetylornithine deacetylase/succinyl-diaminopimelate desuccinylase-like protein